MTTRHARVLIIGSGPAGYTAAIYAARAMLEPVLIAGLEQGGQLMITTEVENYPGYAEAVQGPWMMEQMLEQAKNVGADIVNDLKQRGHVILEAPEMSLFGGAQAVYCLDNGYCAASDPRKDGQAVGY